LRYEFSYPLPAKIIVLQKNFGTRLAPKNSFFLLAAAVFRTYKEHQWSSKPFKEKIWVNEYLTFCFIG
jgi:hypothetical protein